MSPRSRVVALTVASAVGVAAAVVGIAALQTDAPTAAATQPAGRSGAPTLILELGLRTDPEAKALRRAASLYTKGERARAARTFARYDSLEARVGSAFAAWPDGTVDRLNQLAGLHPGSAVVQLNFGVALDWAGEAGAEDAWRQAAADAPDSPYAVVAGSLLHPDYAPGIPVFVTAAAYPPGFDELSPAAQLRALAREAARSVDGKLLYGSALQRLGRPRSAERVFAAALREAPDNVEARVADAVGRFDKTRPVAAFSRLGPLTRSYPHKATVRFHLGLLLLWSGETKEAKRQLGLATTVEPGSPLATVAQTYLDELRKRGV